MRSAVSLKLLILPLVVVWGSVEPQSQYREEGALDPSEISSCEIDEDRMVKNCVDLKLDEPFEAPSILSDEEIETFQREGYLQLPSLFSEEEMHLLKAEISDIHAQHRQETWRESSGAVRTAFAAHFYNEMFARLGKHPRLVRIVEQILGGRVYMHQFKINAKAAFSGEVWQWHQDFGVWHREDAIPEPIAMNIAVFLDEVTEFNGPLYFIPRSHKSGVYDAHLDENTTTYPLWTMEEQKLLELAEEGGLVAPKGKPGTALIFHSNLVHCSPPNLSPWSRNIVYLTLCEVSNHARRLKRPFYITGRNFSPIEPLEDDCLTSHSPEYPLAGIGKNIGETTDHIHDEL